MIVQRLVLYSAGVVAAALLGGSIPLWSRGRAALLEMFLAVSAGVVLGIVGGHLLPEAFEAGPGAAWAIVAGFAFMLVVERFVLPHALHAPHAAEEHEHCDPAEEPAHARADASGVGAFVGLALHTLADGLALGAACADPAVAPYVFLAIASHKVPSAFALGSILVRAGRPAWQVWVASAALGAMVGSGAFLMLLIDRVLGGLPLDVTPYAVGFSAGSFLHVAVTDLLPDLHHAGMRRSRLVLGFLGGLGTMVALRLLWGHTG